jgi:hypothetical protein
MRCPDFLGLAVRAKVIRVLQANQIRIGLRCDTEIDLNLIDCFTPPIMRWNDARYEAVQFPPGVAAYQAACKRLNESPHWLRVVLPVPQYDREWFRSLKPQSLQAGFLFLEPDLTLNEYLVREGFAVTKQPLRIDSWYDGDTSEREKNPNEGAPDELR